MPWNWTAKLTINRGQFTVNYFYQALRDCNFQENGLKPKEVTAAASQNFHRVLSMDREILAKLGQHLEPQIPNAIEHLQRQLGEEVLREMCSEYEECTRSLRHWEKSQSKFTLRIREYNELLNDLEQEILAYLRAHCPE